MQAGNNTYDYHETSSRLPVVLVHGFWDSYTLFRSMASSLTKNGWEVHDKLNFIPNNAAYGIEPLSEQLANYITTNLGSDTKFNLVGFSMGGLVCRYYLQRLGGLARVQKLITISSPHFGTKMAYIFNYKGCIQMRPGSLFLNDLNKDIGTLEKIQCTSIWTKYDTTIIPNNSSSLPFGNKIILPFGIHPLMPRSSRVIKEIVTALGK